MNFIIFSCKKLCLQYAFKSGLRATVRKLYMARDGIVALRDILCLIFPFWAINKLRIAARCIKENLFSLSSLKDVDISFSIISLCLYFWNINFYISSSISHLKVRLDTFCSVIWPVYNHIQIMLNIYYNPNYIHHIKQFLIFLLLDGSTRKGTTTGKRRYL